MVESTRGEVRVLRPLDRLIRQGLLACTAFIAPVLVVLYFLTVPDGPWPVVVATQIFAAVVVTAAASGYYLAKIWIGPGVISERGFFQRMTRFERPEIDSVLLAFTVGSLDEEPTPQLFVRDATGKTLVRMRGQFWSRASMDAVIDALGVPCTISADPVSISELRAESPGLLYWFERHPVIAALVFTGIVAVFGVLLLLLLRAIGVM